MFDVIYKEHPNKELDFFKMLMATEMLRIMIDNEWVNQCLFSIHNKLEKSNHDALEHPSISLKVIQSAMNGKREFLD
jgi:hypothetical protein